MSAERNAQPKKAGPKRMPFKEPAVTPAAAAPRPSESPLGPPGVHLATQQAATAMRLDAQLSLLEHPPFLAYWLSRLLSQIAQATLLYAMLVLIVDRTDSSFYNSIFVVCAILPAVIFGLPAGVTVDAFPRRPMLLGLNLLRFCFVLILVIQPPELAGIFATTLAIWIIHQFYSPAESATLPALVPPQRLTEAQALSNLALVAAQGIGLIVLAPLLLKTSQPAYLFAICAALYLTSAFLVSQLPRIPEPEPPDAHRIADDLTDTLFEGWTITTKDPILFRVSAADVLVGIGLSALVVLAPFYLRRILDTPAENTVFVFAPAVIGVLIGLRLTPWLGPRIGLRHLATIGLFTFALSIAAFGFVDQIYRLLQDGLTVPIDRIAAQLHVPSLALLVMLFSIPAGFASSTVSVVSRTVTLQRAPASARGQVIATQSLVQNLGALAPTLLVGLAADLIGVEQVALGISGLIIAGATLLFLYHRPLGGLKPA